MWQRGKRLSWGEAKGVDSGTKGRWLPMIVNKRGVDVCWLVPASPAISFSLLLPHRASFRHVLPRPHINTQVPRSTPLWSIKPQEAVCQVSEIRVCPPAGDSSSVKEQWESSRESGEAGVDWRQRQKEKGTCAAPGDQPGSLQPGGNYRRLQWLVQVYFQLHRTERHRQRHVKKADNLVKKVAVCLTNRDQSDDKNMIGIGINI